MSVSKASSPSSDVPVAVASFYRFTGIAEPEALRERLAAYCAELGLRGTILLAAEGINATVAGPPHGVDALLDHLARVPGLDGLRTARSQAPRNPFRRLKVRLRPEIVTLGVPGIAPQRRTGTHVTPREWDALLADPRVVVLDTRNDYEFRIGHFERAEAPSMQHFREFPRFVAARFAAGERPPVAMFCTGGIRCEKASAYLLEQGFTEVYQLDGGILRYLADTPAGASRWRGDCFVFDERVAVDGELRPADYEQCPGCRRPVGKADRHAPGYEAGISCPACHDTLSAAQRRAAAERRRQVTLARSRDTAHLGALMPR